MKTLERFTQINDVEYELAVRDESTGYYGSWFCRKCWKGGVKYELLPNVDDAMTQAENGAMQHHETVHHNNVTTSAS